MDVPSGFGYHFAVYREDDGRFSAFAVDLPGTVSHGDTVDEALANVRDALECSIAEYLETDGEIPWVKDGAWTPDGLPVVDIVERRVDTGG